MKHLRQIDHQRVVNTLLRALMVVYIAVGLVLFSTQNIGGVSFGLLMMSGAAFIYLGMAIIQHLKQLRDLLAYSAFGIKGASAPSLSETPHAVDESYEEALYTARRPVTAHSD